MKNSLTIRLLYIAALAATALLWRVPYIAFVVLAAISALLLYVTDWRYVKVYLVCGAMGAVTEVIAIAAGAWDYTKPQVAGIPIWLPLVWGCASIAFVRITHQLADKPKS